MVNSKALINRSRIDIDQINNNKTNQDSVDNVETEERGGSVSHSGPSKVATEA